MTLDTQFAAGMREQLIETAAGRGPVAVRSRRARLAIGLVSAATGVALLTAGAVVIVAGFPGEHIVTDLGTSTTASFTGTSTVELGARPDGANSISFSISCSSAGAFSVTFADGSGISWECSDTPGPRESTTVDPYDQTVPVGHVVNVKNQLLVDGENSFVVETSASTAWSIEWQFANSVTTDWGVNANGETYGVPNERGVPTLHAVLASNCELGYVYWDDFMSAKDGDATPVYESDGETVVGEFWTGDNMPFCDQH
jgi:hypothetical protein